MAPIVKHGFVIVPPLSPWDEKNKALIWADMAHGTFGATEREAWQRQVRDPGLSDGEMAMRIQRWHDRGYRIKSARIEIDP